MGGRVVKVMDYWPQVINIGLNPDAKQELRFPDSYPLLRFPYSYPLLRFPDSYLWSYIFWCLGGHGDGSWLIGTGKPEQTSETPDHG
jgi:hypothetical protein